jgi:hypothetical protein
MFHSDRSQLPTFSTHVAGRTRLTTTSSIRLRGPSATPDVEIDAITRVEVEPVDLPAFAGARHFDRPSHATEPPLGLSHKSPSCSIDLRPEPHVSRSAA